MATKIVTKNSSTASAVPTASDLVQGELAVNVADKRLFTEDNGGSIVELGVNPAAEITANAGIALPDNQKATFGASDDLQIYHDGSDSFVSDVGTGDLYLQGSSNIYFRKGNGGEVFAHFADDGACKLRFDNSTKLATTSTGIDVTGTATVDGLTVDGTSNFNGTINAKNVIYLKEPTSGSANGALFIADTQEVGIQAFGASGHITFDTGSSVAERMKIASNGDISFYEDTGTTPKFHWSSSAESLGIGDIVPQDYLEINGSGRGLGGLTISNSSASHAALSFARSSTATARIYAHEPAALHTSSMNFQTSNASGGSPNLITAMTIDENQNVGIGTSSPLSILHIGTGADANLPITLAPASGGNVEFRSTSSTGSFTFTNANGASEKMRIDSSGNLLVGTTSTSLYNDTSGGGINLFANGGVTFAKQSSSASDPVLLLNNTGTDGQIVDFRKNGTTVGSIGVDFGDRLYIGTGDTALFFNNASDTIQPFNTSGALRDNAIDLGSSSYRFDDIYATNGTIQTSDRNEKQDIAELSDAEQRVAVACKGLLRKFRWKDSVAEKGDDARIHFGIIAQDLQAAFVAEGLDAGDYAMFISTTWTDEETNEEKTRMGVRYSELLAFIISAI